MLEFYNYSFIIILYFYPWCANSVDPERYTRTDIKTRGVPEGKIKVRRGWVWEGVSPSHTLGKKNQNLN